MFTVMHQKDGTEHFHQAEAVVYHGPFSPRPTDAGYFLELVQADKTFDVIGGTAYVMNQAGATVGKYHLGPLLTKAGFDQEFAARRAAGEPMVSMAAATGVAAAN